MKPLFLKNLSSSARTAALQRPAQSAQPQIAAAVEKIVAQVRRDGEKALRRFGKKFEGVDLKFTESQRSRIRRRGETRSAPPTNPHCAPPTRISAAFMPPNAARRFAWKPCRASSAKK